MELSVIENDHAEVKKYLKNFVPDNYYRVLGDAYLYQVRAVLQHAVRNPGEYNVRYDSLINSLTAQFEQNRVNIGQEISAWGNKHTVHAQRLTYLEAENNTVSASITELEKIIISNNKAILEKTNKLAAQLVDFEVGGVNLIHNSTFAKGYRAVGDVAITTSDHVLGTIFKIINLADVEEEIGIGSLVEFNKIKLMEGKQYTLSFYAFGSVELLNNIKLNKGDLVHTLDPIIMDSDISNRKTITFIAPFSGDDIGFSIGTVGYPKDSWFSLVAVQLELGSRATDWSPSPFDNADYIARVAASIEEVRKITIEQQKVNASAIDTLRANIGETKGQISNEREINLTKFSSMTRQLDELTSTTADNTSRITNLDSSYTDKFTANAEKLVELEANVGASNAAITRVDEVVSTNTSAIATSTNNLSAKIDGIKIGGRNLIRNSTFKLGHEAWGDATITRKDTVLGSEVTITNNGSAQFGIQNDVLFRSISLVEDEEYTLSFYGNGNIPSINSIWLKSEGNDPQLLGEIAIDEVLAEKKVLTFTSTITADDVSIIIAAVGYPKGSWFKIVALQLEKGNKATDWTEAPEDIVNFISGVEANIDEFKEVQVAYNEATTTAINTMESTLGENSAKIVENYNTLVSKDEANTRLYTSLSADYGLNKTKVSNEIKAVADNVSASVESISTLRTEFEGNKTGVDSSIKSLADVNKAQTERMDNLYADIGVNSAAIASEIQARTTIDEAIVRSVTVLGTRTEDAEGRISKAETAISTNSGAMAQQKTDITAAYKKAIDDIEIGGRNLLSVSDWETGNIQVTGNVSSGQFLRTKDFFALDGLNKLVFSAKFNFACFVGYYDGAKNFLYSDWIYSTNKFITIEVPAEATYMRLAFRTHPTDATYTLTYVLSEPKLETGNKATDWTPAPEDIEAAISTEATARSDADTALTNLITTLDTDYKGNKTAIRNELTAVSNKVNSTATSLSSLTTTVGNNTTAISTEATARSTADTAIGNRITTVEGKTDNALSRVSTVETIAADNKSSLATTNTEVTAAFKAIDGIKIGGRNLFQQSNYSKHIHSGGIFPSGTSAIVKVEPNTTYTVSYKVTASNRFGIYQGDLVNGLSSNYFSNKSTIIGYTDTTTDELFNRTFTTGAVGEYIMIYLGYGRDYAKEPFLKVEKGNKATDWTPAPEDVTDYIDTSVNNLKTIVDSKASVSRIDAVENTATQALATAKTELTSSFNSTIDSIVIGGRNLVLDSAKEITASSGTAWLKGMSMERNNYYAFSVDLKGTGSIRFVVSTYSRPVSSVDMYGAVGRDAGGTTDIPLTENYQRYWVVILCDNWSIERDTKNVNLILDTGSSVSIKNIKFEKGNKATDWSPAPEDITKYVDTSVSNLKTIVDSKASISRVDTVENNANQAVASAKTALTGSYTTAISVAKGESATDATGKANEAERLAKAYADTKVTALSKVVDSKATISRVDTVENDAKQALATAKTELTSSYKQAIDGIEVGGRNLLRNSQAVSISGADGNYTNLVKDGIEYTVTYDAYAYGYVYLSSEASMVTGQEYTYSIDVATDREISLYLRPSGSKNYDGVYTAPNTAGKWVRVYCAFTYTGSGKGANAQFGLIGFRQASGRTVVKYRNLKLEKGNKGTDWTPPPEDIDSAIQATDARITAEKKVAADATSAVASTVSSLSSTVNGHTSSINETKTSLNGISAKWTMETNVNGKVSGIYQHSTGKKSGLDIITDRFTLSNGTNAGYAPFRQEGNTTYLNMAVIKDASLDLAKINKASITNLSALSANIGHFKSATTGARLEIKDSLLSVYDANNKLRVRIGIW